MNFYARRQIIQGQDTKGDEMKVHGVLVYTSWSHIDLQTNNRRYDPKLGIVDLKNKEIREIEIPSGARVTIEVTSRRFCTFKKNDEKYCLAYWCST